MEKSAPPLSGGAAEGGDAAAEDRTNANRRATRVSRSVRRLVSSGRTPDNNLIYILKCMATNCST